MANVITNPNAGQTIPSHNLLPVVGNKTQSLGNSPLPGTSTRTSSKATL